jgi:PAS domain S-box-containing protein
MGGSVGDTQGVQDYRGRLASFVEAADDAIISTTLDGVITSWNPAAERLFGWTAAEAIGQPATLIVPDHQHAEDEAISRVRRGETVQHFETVRMAKDGHLVSISLTFSPIRDAGGDIMGVSAVGRDISERRQSELVRARLAAIVDSADDVIVSKTLEGVITSWNRAAERLFGWTAAEAVGRHITLIVPPDRHAEEEQVLAKLRRGERVEHFETVRRSKDGRLVDVSITVSPVRDDSGRVVGASKIGRDISQRRDNELVQARLAAIVDSSDDVIISKTLDGVITSWNRAAERLFGWTAAEAVGRHITLIVPDAQRAEEREVLARIRRGERVEHFDTVRRAKDGRLVDVSITVSPVRDGAGRIIGASKIARDVSERRRLEDERARLLVREQEARLQAEDLNRTKDHLLATVSHELRTPLNSIFGWARMMQSTPMDEAARARAVGAIVRCASAQARLVEDLLDLSRIVTGRMRLDFEIIDVNAVIEAALDTVRPAARTKDIALVVNLDDAIGKMEAAPDRLQQVVWNLVMNAVKFTPRGGRVEVSSRRAGDLVEIVVADTGEGIAPDVLSHVFEPFRQEDSSSTRAHAGLGLGLTLVRQLVELHGGAVHAESPGKQRGARFTVTLPVVASRTDAEDQNGERGSDSARPRRLRGVRVLVVDDDTDSLDMSTSVLRDAGADVRAASSAFIAYDLADSWEPHVVLTDLAMPGEDGFMLLDAMRATFRRRGVKVPIVAVTAYGTSENRERAVQAGFDLYVTKPIDPVDLTTVLAELVRRTT